MSDWTLESLADSYRRIGFKRVEIARGEPAATAEIWIRPDPLARMIDEAWVTSSAAVFRRFGDAWLELGRLPITIDAPSSESTAATPPRAAPVGTGAVGQLQIGWQARASGRGGDPRVDPRADGRGKRET